MLNCVDEPPPLLGAMYYNQATSCSSSALLPGKIITSDLLNSCLKNTNYNAASASSSKLKHKRKNANGGAKYLAHSYFGANTKGDPDDEIQFSNDDEDHLNEDTLLTHVESPPPPTLPSMTKSQSHLLGEDDYPQKGTFLRLCFVFLLVICKQSALIFCFPFS